jgi:hypothetical protein
MRGAHARVHVAEGALQALHLVDQSPKVWRDQPQQAHHRGDGARLQLQLSYNWHFNIDLENKESWGKIFNVKDFVGDACSAIASKVRGEVASLTFENFHKGSARHIRAAIFGLDKEGKV